MTLERDVAATRNKKRQTRRVTPGAERTFNEFVSVYDDTSARLFKIEASTAKNAFPASPKDQK